MRKLLNKPWFVAVLAVAALAMVAWSVFDQSGPAYARTSQAGDADDWATPVDDNFDFAEGLDSEGSINDALNSLVIQEVARDPFLPLREGGKQSPVIGETPRAPDEYDSIRLTAIWEQGTILLLMINNRIHQVGDTIGRLRIDSATTDGVWITHWKGRDFLPFGGAFTLVTPAAPTANSTTASDES